MPGGKHKLFFIYQNNVSHNTLGSAYSGSLSKSLVIDHLDNRGTEEFIKRLGEIWIEEIYPNKPTNFFIDSFELIGELPWSEKLFDAMDLDQDGTVDYSEFVDWIYCLERRLHGPFLHHIGGKQTARGYTSVSCNYHSRQ